MAFCLVFIWFPFVSFRFLWLFFGFSLVFLWFLFGFYLVFIWFPQLVEMGATLFREPGVCPAPDLFLRELARARAKRLRRTGTEVWRVRVTYGAPTPKEKDTSER